MSFFTYVIIIDNIYEDREIILGGKVEEFKDDYVELVHEFRNMLAEIVENDMGHCYPLLDACMFFIASCVTSATEEKQVAKYVFDTLVEYMDEIKKKRDA